MRPAYSLRRLASSSSAASLRQHFRKADDGIERRTQFVAHGGEEAAFGGIGALGLRMRVEQRLLLLLRSVTSRNTATTSRRSRSPASAVGLFERPAAHLDPDEFHDRTAVGIDAFTPHAEFDRTRFRQSRGIAERVQIGRAVGDMDPVEQAVSMQIGSARAEQRSSAAGDTNSTAPSRPCRVITSVMLRAKSR